MYRNHTRIFLTQNLMIIDMHLPLGEQALSNFSALQAVEKIGLGDFIEKLSIEN